MNRDDVIDVLSVVAAATRRSVGETDVEIWLGVIGDLDKPDALQAVRDHLRERPGIWLEPGHIVERVRATRRDRLEREPDRMREARQDALAAKALEDAEELAQRKGIPGPAKFKRPPENYLAVPCPWCRAGVGQSCTVPRTNVKLTQRPAHDSRIEAMSADA